MTTPRVYRANAIVLGRTPLGETDRIVSLFTREKGKLRAVAKGARRPVSKLAGGTELFGYCRVMLSSGQNLDVLTQVESRESFPALRKSLDRIYAASYLTELTDQFTDDRHPNADLFDLLLAALYITSSGTDLAWLTALYTLQMMDYVGYAPAFDPCVRCNRHSPSYPGFSPDLGGVMCPACIPYGKGLLRTCDEAVRIGSASQTAELADLARLQVSPLARRQILRLTRAFLTERLERPLRSARFLDEWLAANDTNGETS